MLVIVGKCEEVMARMLPESVDAVVCDPPYGLEFMGKEWDKLSGTPGYNERGRITERPDAQVPYGRGGGVNSYQAGKPMQDWHERWAREALRVLKPGGYLLAFGSPRTVHRLACAIEDAGFEIRDRIMVEAGEVSHPAELAWMYGSGFPKSMNVSLAIDKAAGVEREVLGNTATTSGRTIGEGVSNGFHGGIVSGHARDITAPATELAAKWDGWGTALKPAYEPIVVARKPLIGTVVANVLKHGTGGINVAATKLQSKPRLTGTVNEHVESGVNGVFGKDARTTRQQSYDARQEESGEGRHPANLILLHAEECVRVGARSVASNGHFPAARPAGSEVAGASGHVGQDGLAERHMRGELVEEWECVAGCPVAALDAQSVTRGIHSAGSAKPAGGWPESPDGMFGLGGGEFGGARKGDSGGASRFFYVAKAARSEREAGLLGKVTCAICGGLDTLEHDVEAEGIARTPMAGRGQGGLKCVACGKWKVSGSPCVCEEPQFEPAEFDGRHGKCIRNDHPTVKPIDVMRWLVRLVTPPGGTVLDPFTGSGTTGVACALEGFTFTGIEQDERNALIACTRIDFWEVGGEAALADLQAAERELALASRKREEREQAGQASLFELFADGVAS